MADRGLGFDFQPPEEFGPQSVTNPFAPGTEEQAAPGEELGALEVAPEMEESRQFGRVPRKQRPGTGTETTETVEQVAAPEEAQIAEEDAEDEMDEDDELAMLEEQAQAEAEAAEEAERLRRRQNNTSRLFLVGSLIIIIFPPAGVPLLKWPILVEKLETGARGLPMPGAVKLLDRFAPYSPGKRIMANLLIWGWPPIYAVMAAVIAGLLIAMVVLMAMCTSESTIVNFISGTACSYWFGI